MESQALVVHSSLKYSSDNMPSTVQGRVQRTKLYPQTSSFNPGSDIRIKLPANETASYADLNHRSYLNFTITPVGNDLTLERSGVMGLFQNFLIQTPSQEIYDCSDINNLMSAMMDLQCDQLYKGNIAALQQGTTVSNIGQVLTAGAGTSYNFSIPLPVNPLSLSNSYIPLFSREEIELVFTLADINAYGRWAGAPTSCVMTNVELIMDVIKLNPESQAMVDAMCGGVYKISTTGINNSRKTLAAGVTNNEVTVDTNVNFLDKILCTWRVASAQDAHGSFQTARVDPSLTKMQFSVNGKNYPQQQISGSNDNKAEFLSETLSAFNMLGNSNAPSSLNAQGDITGVNVAGTTATSKFLLKENTTPTTAGGSDSGSFLAAINLSTLHENSNELYNGVSTVGANTLLKTQHAAMAANVVQNVYCFYNERLILDMNKDQQFMVIV